METIDTEHDTASPLLLCYRCGMQFRKRDISVFLPRDDDSGQMGFLHAKCMGREGWQRWLEREFPRWIIQWVTDGEGWKGGPTTFTASFHGFRTIFKPSLDDREHFSQDVVFEQAYGMYSQGLDKAILDLAGAMRQFENDCDMGEPHAI